MNFRTVLAQCGVILSACDNQSGRSGVYSRLVPDAEAGLVNVLSSLGRGEAMAMGEAADPNLIYAPSAESHPNSNDIDFLRSVEKRRGGSGCVRHSRAWRRQKNKQTAVFSPPVTVPCYNTAPLRSSIFISLNGRVLPWSQPYVSIWCQ